MSPAKRPAGPSPSGPSDSDAERNTGQKKKTKTKKTKKASATASDTDGEPTATKFLKNRDESAMDDGSDAPTTKRDAPKAKAKKTTELMEESDSEALIEKIKAKVAETQDKDTRRFLKRLIKHERDSAALKARFAALEVTMLEKEKSIERLISAMADVTRKCDDLSERFNGIESAKKKKTTAPSPTAEDAAALQEVAELQALRAPLYGENKAGGAKGFPALKAPTEQPPQRFEEWSVVENRKKKKQAAKVQQKQQQPPQRKNPGKSSKKRPQNPAILLQGEKPQEIMDALKLARKNKDFDEQLRPHVEGLRTAIRSTGVVIELKKGTENLEALNKALSDAVGDKATAKSVTPQEELCCTGVEAFYTEEEFCTDVKKQLDLTLEPSRVRLRPSRDGRQVASFLVPLHRVEELLTKKINVGWTANIAIQRSSWKPRCRKCLEIGHIESTCKGPDRKNLCLRCGMLKHMDDEQCTRIRCIKCKSDGHIIGNAACTGKAQQCK